MFNKEDGPTALRADLVRGLSLSRGPQEVQTDKGVERYMYAQPLTEESGVIHAQAEALSFARNLGFSMDEPAFRELDEESREKRLDNWNLIRKVRETLSGVEEAALPAVIVGSADEFEPIPSVAPEPLEEDSLELALAGGPRDDDTPVELPPLGDPPEDDDTPLELAPIGKGPAEDEGMELAPVSVVSFEDEGMELEPVSASSSEDEGMELAPIDGAPSKGEPLELAPVTEAPPEDEALELALANGAASSGDESLQFEAGGLDLSPVSDELEDGESLEFEPLGDAAGPADTQPIGAEPEELVLEPAVPEAELDSAEAPAVEAIEPPLEIAEAFEIEHELDFLGASAEEESASEPNVLVFVDSEPAASDPPTIQLTTPLAPDADAVEPEFTPDQLSELAELEVADSEPPGIESAAVAANEGRPTGEPAAAIDTGSAVIGKIELVRKEGADRRRLTALGRLLSFF